MKSRWTFVIVLGLVCALAAWAVFFRETTTAKSYITLPARRGSLESVIMATGSIEPANLVSVGAQVSGRVVALYVTIGQHVTAGQRIADIDSVPQVNALARGEAGLKALQAQRARAKAALRQTELAFSRQRDIVAGKAGTRQDYDTAEAAYASAQADLAALDAQIEGANVGVQSARADLAYTKITAPRDGTVVAIVTQLGQTVISYQVAPTIVRIADLGTMSVKAKVSEADISRLRPGIRVHLSTVAQPERYYETTLKTIDPAPDQIAIETSATNQSASNNASGTDNPAVYFNARFEISNKDGALRPLMTALVSFVLDEVKDAILVPVAAVQRTSKSVAHVRILDRDGKPEDRQVHTGLDNGAEIQILNGVAAGEAVIVADAKDGARFASWQERTR